jgi:hypothetical protein
VSSWESYVYEPSAKKDGRGLSAVLTPDEYKETSMITHAELIQKAYDQKKLRYPPAVLDLSKHQVLELNRTGFSGVEFSWNADTKTIEWPTQSIDGEDLDLSDFIQELAKAVGEDPLDFLMQDDLHTDHMNGTEPAQLRQYIVTQKTSIMAFDEDDAIEAVNNMEKGDRYPEIIEQTAKKFDDGERIISEATLEDVIFHAMNVVHARMSVHHYQHDPYAAEGVTHAEDVLSRVIREAVE